MSVRSAEPRLLGIGAICCGKTIVHVIIVGRRKTLVVYHNICLEHVVPESHLDKPDRLRIAINTINEVRAAHPNLIDVNSNPPEGSFFYLKSFSFHFSNTYLVDNRYVMVVHEPSYIKSLKSALTTSTSTSTTTTTTTTTPATSTITATTTSSTANTVNITNAPTITTTNFPAILSHPAILSTVRKDLEKDPDFPDAFISPHSFSAALRAAGAVCFYSPCKIRKILGAF